MCNNKYAFGAWYLNSKEKCDKKDLLRIVKNKEGQVFLDSTGKANGRGAYLKKELDVIEKAEKTKLLERVLEIEVPSEIYEEMKILVK